MEAEKSNELFGAFRHILGVGAWSPYTCFSASLLVNPHSSPTSWSKTKRAKHLENELSRQISSQFNLNLPYGDNPKWLGIGLEKRTFGVISHEIHLVFETVTPFPQVVSAIKGSTALYNFKCYRNLIKYYFLFCYQHIALTHRASVVEMRPNR